MVLLFLFWDFQNFYFQSTLLNLGKVGLPEMTLWFLWGFLRGVCGEIYIKNTYKTRKVGLKIMLFIRLTKLGRIKLANRSAVSNQKTLWRLNLNIVPPQHSGGFSLLIEVDRFSSQVTKFRSYAQRGVLFGCWFFGFLVGFGGVFVFLGLIKCLQNWASWANFTFFVVFVCLSKEIYIKICVKYGKYVLK